MRLFGIVALSALALAGCTPDFVEENESNVILRIVKITATAGGAAAAEESDFLLSDVSRTFNDNAIIEFEALPKNQNPGAVVGVVNDVFLERYEVRFVRSDGRNQEGVDVPFRFAGAMATLIPAGGRGSAAVIVVRHQAKLEPPLLNMVGIVFPFPRTFGFPAEGIVYMTAEMTFHGRTTSGKGVRAAGRLNVGFADFADPT